MTECNMENNRGEMIFCDGMGFKAVSPNAPESVRGQIYFNVAKFTKFLQENADAKGWVNTKMMKSKDKGTIYFILDTYKKEITPEREELTREYNETKYKPVGYAEEAGIDVKNHPLLTDEERNQVNEEDIDLSKIPF